METGSSANAPVPRQSGCRSPGGPQSSGDARPSAGSSAISLAYNKDASQLPSSTGIIAGVGLLKLATSQWNREQKALKQMSGSNCGVRTTSPLEQLASLVLSGQTRLRQLGQGGRVCTDATGFAKPQNCKRVVVLGSPRVGKTSILRRYVRDGFVEDYQPTSEDFLSKLFRIRGETYQVDVLDASGERGFPAKRRLSILTGDIFLLVFSVDDRASFEEVCALRAEILAAKDKLARCSCSAPSSRRARVPLLVCANKVDLPAAQRDVGRAEAIRALGEDCAYFETSAKDSTNLDKAFEMLAERGGLPAETSPCRHRKVSLRSYHTQRTDPVPRQEIGRAPSSGDDPCGALLPLARRPSLSADLRQVMEPAPAKEVGALERCRIQ